MGWKDRGWYRSENETPSQKAGRRKAPPKKKRRGRKRNRAFSYEARDRHLQGHEFSSYRSYLDSAIWAALRTRVFAKSRRCFVCHRAGKARHVHHMVYTADNLTGGSLRGLKPVCASCHRLIEFDREGKKLSPGEVRKKAKRLSRSKSHQQQMKRMSSEAVERWIGFRQATEGLEGWRTRGEEK